MRFDAFLIPASRAIALFLGGLAGLNLIGLLTGDRFEAARWWIDLRLMPDFLTIVLLILTTLFLGAWGVQPVCKPWRRWTTAALTGVLVAMTASDALTVWTLQWRGTISSSHALSASALCSIALTGILIGVMRQPANEPDAPHSHRLLVMAGLCLCILIFPLMQILCFGRTDYRRQADAVVVFGCRAYSNDAPSLALSDRVRTACDLYRQGLVEHVVFSGGPADGDAHETEAMRRMAIRHGIPAQAIHLDQDGLNTSATVRNTTSMFRAMGAHRVLAVSHGYHLPRIKMTYQRAGLDVWTVPAKETRPLLHGPYYIAREVAAIWVYYLRSIMG